MCGNCAANTVGVEDLINDAHEALYTFVKGHGVRDRGLREMFVWGYLAGTQARTAEGRQSSACVPRGVPELGL